jgi:hypothetical protein
MDPKIQASIILDMSQSNDNFPSWKKYLLDPYTCNNIKQPKGSNFKTVSTTMVNQIKSYVISHGGSLYRNDYFCSKHLIFTYTSSLGHQAKNLPVFLVVTAQVFISSI